MTLRENLQLTGALLQFQDVVIGTSQFSYELAIIFTFSQPAIALEAERLIQGGIFHVDVFQVPARCDSFVVEKEQIYNAKTSSRRNLRALKRGVLCLESAISGPGAVRRQRRQGRYLVQLIL